MARYVIVKSWVVENQRYFWEAYKVNILSKLLGFNNAYNFISNTTSVVDAEDSKRKLMKVLNKEGCTYHSNGVVEMYIDA